MKRPTNEVEFLSLMEEVDSLLAARSMQLHARPLGAWHEIAMKLKMSLQIGGYSRKRPIEGIYNEQDLTLRIFDWYEKRYGDSLKIDFSPGRVFLVIRGAPWVMTFPKIFGTMKFNILESLREIPIGLKQSLSSDELQHIIEAFNLGYTRICCISNLNGIKLCAEGRVDIEGAINNVFGITKSYGQSRWCSLQATEKFLKAYISSKGMGFPKTHKLEDLRQLIHDQSLAEKIKVNLKYIQCDPSIRYGEGQSTLEDAWKAHWASILACGDLAQAMNDIAI